MLLREAFERYRQDVIIFGNQSHKTEENHLVAEKSLLAFIGRDILVTSLTFDMVREWVTYLRKTRSPETVRNYVIKLRVVLAYAKNSGYDVLNPDTIPVPKRGDKVPSYISKEDVAKLINNAISLRDKAIISLLYSSGIRVGECSQLNREDIKGDTFTVIGKGSRARLCFVDERSQHYLRVYLATRRDNNPALFLTEKKTRITSGRIQEMFKEVRARAGMPHVHAHTLRHSFATNLLQQNCNLYYVQRMLGHQSLQTTQQYLHVVDEDLRGVFHKYHTI